MSVLEMSEEEKKKIREQHKELEKKSQERRKELKQGLKKPDQKKTPV